MYSYTGNYPTDNFINDCSNDDSVSENIKYHQMNYININMNKLSKQKMSVLRNYDINELFPGEIKPFIVPLNGSEGHYCSYSDIDYFAYKYNNACNIYPNFYRLYNFNVKKFVNDLFKHIDVPLSACHKSVHQMNARASLTSLLILFHNNTLVWLNSEETCMIYFNPEDEKNKSSFLYTFLSICKNYMTQNIEKNKIFVVYRGVGGFEKQAFNVKKIKIDIDKNYNDDFKEISNKIIEGLNNKNKSNLVILSGDPGVGKTTYIRYLTSKLKKNIIFISPDMVSNITDPAFIPFLINNDNSILIIEDAEPALEKRNNDARSSSVSNVLNLTDGLLSDCLNISILATFNTDKKTLDDALLRKGRLLMNYKFEKLSVEKSKNLLKELGHKDIEIKEPMTLADIYFYGEDNNVKDKKSAKIGF